MVQSSNYKTYERTPRTLTEETAFAGGMMWTGNNIDEMHLRTIVNFNYDETTGFLKTRNPFNIIEHGESGLTDLKPALWDRTHEQLIGAYNICYTDLDTDTVSKAGWLYLFGEVTKDGSSYRCREDSLVWLYRDSNEIWHRVKPYSAVAKPDTDLPHPTWSGTTGIRPILYDNSLYCTKSLDESTNEAFFVYRLFAKTLTTEQVFNCDGKTTQFVLDTPHKRILACNIDDDDTVYVEGVDWTYDVTTKTVTFVQAPVNEAVLHIVWSTDEELDFYVSRQAYDSKDTFPSLFPDTVKDHVYSTTLLEASVTGFNALRGEDTYKYTSTIGNTPKAILGIYLKDEKNNICVTPRIGQKVTVYPVLDAVKDDGTPTGTLTLSRLLKDPTITTDKLWSTVATTEAKLDASFTYTVVDEETTFKLDWFNGETLIDTTIVTYNSNKLNTQLKLKPYKLPTAQGSCLWNGHLVLWDIAESSNTLFISEVDNLYYMPVPNNVALFETDVISCIPYMGALLVFTADRIYRLSENKDGGFIQEVVQNNMPLSRADAPYLRAIKNMVFFRSGKYFYMIVPKSQSLTGELSVAPIYKNLSRWFNEPNKAMGLILSQLYPENQYHVVLDDKQLDIEDTITVRDPMDIYIEQDTVSILYPVSAWYTTSYIEDGVRKITKAKQQHFLLFVNYNTNLRAWTMYLEETTTKRLFPAALTASRVMAFARVTNTGAFDVVTMSDSTSAELGVPCLLDTGYRTLSNALRKRFREVQIKLYSETENITQFGSAFYVDGSVRRSYSHMEQATLADNNTVINLTPVFDPNTLLVETSMPFNNEGVSSADVADTGSDSIELSDWALDFSHFKRGAPSTVRIPVSGKGYSPRLVLISNKCIALHINEISWVYRLMNGR